MRYHKLKASDEPGVYIMESAKVTEADILTMANQLARQRLSKGRVLNNPETVQSHMRTLLQDYEHEVFIVVTLDSRFRIIGLHEMFQGTLNTATVHPREVVKLALKANAAALILAHNHPSGDPSPSASDIQLTKVLKQALALIDVRVLDHIVVGTEGCTSLAEKGLM